MDTIEYKFSNVSKDIWKEQLIKDLKGKVAAEDLPTTINGIEIEPYKDAEDLQKLSYLKDYHQLIINTEKDNFLTEKFLCLEDEKQAFDIKEKISLLRENGLDGVAFSKPSFDTAILNERNDLSYSYYLDQKACSTNSLAETVSFIKDNNQGFHFLLNSEIDSEIFNQIWNTSEDISLSINADANKPSLAIKKYLDFISSVLNQGKPDLESLLKRISISIESSENYLFNIANIRAVRVVLFYTLKNIYSETNIHPLNISIHTRQRFDKNIAEDSIHLNFLSSINQFMSSYIANANRVTFEVNSSKKDLTQLFQRLSMNALLIMENESGFDKVIDAAGGSYFIDALTHKIASKIWEEMKR